MEQSGTSASLEPTPGLVARLRQGEVPTLGAGAFASPLQLTIKDTLELDMVKSLKASPTKPGLTYVL